MFVRLNLELYILLQWYPLLYKRHYIFCITFKFLFCFSILLFFAFIFLSVILLFFCFLSTFLVWIFHPSTYSFYHGFLPLITHTNLFNDVTVLISTVKCPIPWFWHQCYDDHTDFVFELWIQNNWQQVKLLLRTITTAAIMNTRVQQSSSSQLLNTQEHNNQKMSPA